jgi:hypothetical protein
MLSNSDPDELQSHLSGESSDSLSARIAQLEARIASLEAALQTAGLWSPAEDVSTDEIDRNPN